MLTFHLFHDLTQRSVFHVYKDEIAAFFVAQDNIVVLLLNSGREFRLAESYDYVAKQLQCCLGGCRNLISVTL